MKVKIHIYPAEADIRKLLSSRHDIIDYIEEREFIFTASKLFNIPMIKTDFGYKISSVVVPLKMESLSEFRDLLHEFDMNFDLDITKDGDFEIVLSYPRFIKHRRSMGRIPNGSKLEEILNHYYNNVNVGIVVDVETAKSVSFMIDGTIMYEPMGGGEPIKIEDEDEAILMMMENNMRDYKFNKEKFWAFRRNR